MDINKILELKEKRAKLTQQIRSILDEFEGKEMPAEKSEEVRKIEADFDSLNEKINREERQLERERLAGQKQEKRKENVSDEEREHRALDLYLRKGDVSELRALEVGTATEGGNLVPEDFKKKLIMGLEEQNIMRGLATTISADNVQVVIPTVSSHGSAAWTAEEGAFTESDEVFGQILIDVHKATTLIKVSEELLHDSAFNLVSYLNTEFQRRLGALEESAFVNGDGASKPYGVFNEIATGVTAASNSAITTDEVMDLYYSLGTQYRGKASFVMNDSTEKVIRKLKDSNGQYIWSPGITAGQPNTLFGRPVRTAGDVPAIASTANVIGFGDYKYYYIADNSQIAMQRLNELYSVNGQVGFRIYKRTGGRIILAEAFKALTMAV